jgi:hypothetical protein
MQLFIHGRLAGVCLARSHESGDGFPEVGGQVEASREASPVEVRHPKRTRGGKDRLGASMDRAGVSNWKDRSS